MKRFLLATVALVALAAPAAAADLAARPYTKAPPPVIPIYDWTGFYIGANGGWGTSRKCWDLVVATPAFPATLGSEGCHDTSGGTVGGQIGYRWQTPSSGNGAWVWGVEGQGNWADFRGDNISLLFPTDRNRSRIDAFGLITGQVGYAWNTGNSTSILWYFKGGAAVTEDKYDVFFVPTGGLLSSSRETRWGGTVGTGFEYGFAQGWSVGVEYDHLFMGRRNHDFITPAGAFDGTDRIRQDVDMVLARINYHFGWGSAAIGAPGFGR